VINDLATDNRVQRTARVLSEAGYDVRLIGRMLPGSLPVPEGPWQATRMRMLFRTGPAFYAFFNLRLLFRLLFSRADLLFANDLDTLAPNYMVSRLRNIRLIYDSHELFTEVPELQQTHFKRRIWERLERWIVPKLKTCITVNDSIANVLKEKYGVPFNVVRNIPDKRENFIPKSRRELGLPDDKRIILLQGAGINIGRGAEELVEAMKSVDSAILLLIGGGDVWPIVEKMVRDQKLADRVILKKKMPSTELAQYTANADIGVSIDKPTNLNYFLSLPNKLFDYIHAGVPVLCSRLPELEKIVTEYKVGTFIGDHTPSGIATKLNELLKSPQLQIYRDNTRTVAASLNWSTEKEKLIRLLKV
jgi:glycosyltransferase involved in cell wall biosynthesis